MARGITMLGVTAGLRTVRLARGFRGAKPSAPPPPAPAGTMDFSTAAQSGLVALLEDI
jgi:hypothetical protein